MAERFVHSIGLSSRNSNQGHPRKPDQFLDLRSMPIKPIAKLTPITNHLSSIINHQSPITNTNHQVLSRVLNPMRFILAVCPSLFCAGLSRHASSRESPLWPPDQKNCFHQTRPASVSHPTQTLCAVPFSLAPNEARAACPKRGSSLPV